MIDTPQSVDVGSVNLGRKGVSHPASYLVMYCPEGFRVWG